MSLPAETNGVNVADDGTAFRIAIRDIHGEVYRPYHEVHDQEWRGVLWYGPRTRHWEDLKIDVVFW